MTNWIQDWFGSEYYSILYRHRDCDEAKLFLDNIISFLKLPAESKILDCGCGRGRHSIYLSEKGFEVTGIDISEKNISFANEYEKENLLFYVHDMRSPFRENYYDAALNLFTSFGYFEKDAENNKVIKSMASSLKKDGWLLLDFMNAKKGIQNLVPEATFACDNVQFKIKRFVQDGFIVKEIEVTDKGKKHFFAEQVKAYDKIELKKLFEANKLKVVHLLGDYELNPFDEKKSERLILIARKI